MREEEEFKWENLFPPIHNHMYIPIEKQTQSFPPNISLVELMTIMRA